MNTPLNTTTGIDLVAGPNDGIARAVVTAPERVSALSWDRYVRLKAAADELNPELPQTILDAGGFDGALAFFLPQAVVDVIDPATTGGSVLEIPAKDGAYETVVAVDVLEHIHPADRSKALSEFARVAAKRIVLNYPCRESSEAQALVLRLTNNPLIKEHVHWELPDSTEVVSEMAKHHFAGIVKAHTSIAIWLGQYVTLNLVPQAAIDLNSYLVKYSSNEPTTTPLYHLVVCTRI